MHMPVSGLIGDCKLVLFPAAESVTGGQALTALSTLHLQLIFLWSIPCYSNY